MKLVSGLALAFSLGLSGPAPGPARADPISGQILQALQGYEQGRFGDARRALSLASDQIQQRQEENLKGLLPGPAAGWVAEEPLGGSAAASLLGGDVSASRRYGKRGLPDGGPIVDIEIVGATPLVDALGALLASPDAVAGEPGAMVVEVKGRRALLRLSRVERAAEVSLILRSRVLVSIRGQGVDGPDDVLAYAHAVDLQAVEQCLRP